MLEDQQSRPLSSVELKGMESQLKEAHREKVCPCVSSGVCTCSNKLFKLKTHGHSNYLMSLLGLEVRRTFFILTFI